MNFETWFKEESMIELRMKVTKFKTEDDFTQFIKDLTHSAWNESAKQRTKAILEITKNDYCWECTDGWEMSLREEIKKAFEKG